MIFKSFVVLFTLFSFFAFCSCNYLLEQDRTLTQSQENFIHGILKTVDMFYQFYHCHNLNIFAKIKNKLRYDGLIRSKVIHQIISSYTTRLASRNITLKGMHRWRCNIFIIEGIELFREAEAIINPKLFRYHGFFLFVLIDGYMKELQQIFDAMFMKHIINAYAIYIDDMDGTTLATYFPFDNHFKCGDTTPVAINRFKDYEFIHKFELNSKLKNLNKCPIRVDTFYANVAVMKKNFTDGTFEVFGFEVSMMKTLAELLNFTLILRYREGNDQWGSVYSNGTATYIFKDLQERKIDIGMGDYFLKSSRLKYFDSSLSYLNYPLILIVPKGEKFTVFEKFFMPFQSIVWFLLFLTITTGIVVILIINSKLRHLKSFIFGNGIKHPLTNMLIIIVGSQQHAVPKRNFARFLLTMFIILCLVLRSIYQGSLYLFLQSDGRHKEVQSIEELISKNYQLLIHDSFVETVENDSRILRLSHLDKGDEPLDIMMSKSNRTAVVGARLLIVEYSLTHKTFPYKICPEKLLTANVVLYYAKNFYLKDSIDYYIGKIVSSGFIEYWIGIYDYTKYWKNSKHKPRIIKIEHVKGSFYLLAFGCIFAFVLFLAEIYVHKMTQRKTIRTLLFGEIFNH